MRYLRFPKDREVILQDTKTLCPEGRIWDLHIHSCRCPKAQASYKDMTITEYLDDLVPFLEGYERLDMISFTDHNHISFELYKEFYGRSTRIKLLPGIEIDIKLDPDGVSKHLVVYFDCMEDIDKLERLSANVNALMKGQYKRAHSSAAEGERSEAPRAEAVSDKNPIYIGDLLSNLIDMKVPFLVSPHAMKQGQRAIDYDWQVDVEDPANRDVDKYLDQFFCFWETSGQSSIARVISFLQEIDREDRLSIIAFSDSHAHERDKLKAYLDKPPQYFRALPSFNGVKMAGTEFTRILKRPEEIPTDECGRYLGKIEFSGNEITLSPRMNAIIGSRGSGKSLLLDAVAMHLGCSIKIPDSRRKYIAGFTCSVENYSGTETLPGSFHVDYFGQNYVAQLFNKSGKAYNDDLKSYFKEAFDAINDIPTTEIKSQNEIAFTNNLSQEITEEPENISGLVDKYVIDDGDKLDLKIAKKNREKVDKKLSEFKYDKFSRSMLDAIDKKTPEFLKNDNEYAIAKEDFIRAVCTIAQGYREAYLENAFLHNTIIDEFLAKKNQANQRQERKSEVEKQFEDEFERATEGIRRRASLIKAYLRCAIGFKCHYEERGYADGENEDAFCFKKTLDVQHPLDYLIEKLNEYIRNGNKGECTAETIGDYIDDFIFDEGCYLRGHTCEELYTVLKGYALSYTDDVSINYRRDEAHPYQDLREMSPGSQTNSLLEYVVNRHTLVPLLIDQPEDNVDTETIVNDVRAWFSGIKAKRQVLVVTHDANIVINADAENVIIATHPDQQNFKYENGALEYGEVLDRASNILDGGKDAVRRRLVKYGD